MSAARRFPVGVHRSFSRIRPGHFWFETRRDIVTDVVRRFRAGRGGAALEVGCGDGFVLRQLPGSRWIGVDQTMDDLRVVWRNHGIPAIAASAVALPLRVTFEMVAAFDVLEHIEDDVAALRVWRSLLEAPGHLIVTVPAGPELWSRRDDFARHCRRYSRASLRAAMEKAGLCVERVRPVFRTLWPLAWLSARVSRARPIEDPADEYRVSGVLNMVLRVLLRTEEWALGRSDRGRGTSWLVVARPAPPVAKGDER